MISAETSEPVIPGSDACMQQGSDEESWLGLMEFDNAEIKPGFLTRFAGPERQLDDYEVGRSRFYNLLSFARLT